MSAAAIDEDLYSRQLCVIGHNAMQAIASSNILLVGLNGLGVEIAKNIILGGLKSISLLDETLIEPEDLGCQYYLTEEDIGKSKAVRCLSKLRELNDYVNVNLVQSDNSSDISKIRGLTESLILSHQLVILSDQSMSDCMIVGDVCHANGIMLIAASTFGLCGRIFCDLGEEFHINDVDGNDERISHIQYITKEQNAKVVCCSETPHNLFDNMIVTLDKIEGMVELNKRSFSVEIINKFTFSIDTDTTSYHDYIKGGIIVIGKQKETYHFKSLREAISLRELVKSSTDKMEFMWSLHSCFVILEQFVEKFNRLPTKFDTASFLQLADEHEMCSKTPNFERISKLFCQTCRGNLSPMNSIIGGFAAQEAMKAISSQFRPLRQFFYLDFFECLPEKVYDLEDTLASSDEEVHPRYSTQVSIFGKEFQNKLENANIFVAGAGAIGCELLKNFALMGVACGENGRLTLTDMDIIEKSNLNRQFLFRNSDVKKSKSLVAGKSAQQFNPKINIICHENKIGQESENIYNDQFYESLDCVVTALDNVQARQYLNDQCLMYRKAFLDSGTLGTQCSTQCVLPDLTKQYSLPNENEEHIPVCTLKHFPYEIAHTIQWARSKFSELFEEASFLAIKFINNKAECLSQIEEQPHYDRLFKFTTLVDIIENPPNNFCDCVRWAKSLFDEYFKRDIENVLYYYPSDKITSSGVPFWSGVKRCPQPSQFDPKEDLHVDFIMSAANLRATLFSIDTNRDRVEVGRLVSSITDDAPSSRVIAPVAENDDEEEKLKQSVSADTLEHIKELEGRLRAVTPSGINICSIEFEKDDDTNFHMDFITAASNLRALNYNISPADRLKTKQVAGRIIPAIATTTSYVAGLVCMEFYKLMQGHRDLKYFRDQFTNLAVPFVAMNFPMASNVMEYNVSGAKKTYTIWDHFEFTGDVLISDFLKQFKEMYGLEITLLRHKTKIIYANFWSQGRLKEVLNKSIYCELQNLEGRPTVKSILLELLCMDGVTQEPDMSVPPVRLTFSK